MSSPAIRFTSADIDAPPPQTSGKTVKFSASDIDSSTPGKPGLASRALSFVGSTADKMARNMNVENVLHSVGQIVGDEPKEDTVQSRLAEAQQATMPGLQGYIAGALSSLVQKAKNGDMSGLLAEAIPYALMAHGVMDAAAPEAMAQVRAGAKGGIAGGAKAAISTTPLTPVDLPWPIGAIARAIKTSPDTTLQVPTVPAAAVSGYLAGKATRVPYAGELGAVAGGATPIVRGIISGAQKAMAEAGATRYIAPDVAPSPIEPIPDTPVAPQPRPLIANQDLARPPLQTQASAIEPVQNTVVSPQPRPIMAAPAPRTPLWAESQQTVTPAEEAAPQVQSPVALPSGRTPGGIQNQVETPSAPEAPKQPSQQALDLAAQGMGYKGFSKVKDAAAAATIRKVAADYEGIAPFNANAAPPAQQAPAGIFEGRTTGQEIPKDAGGQYGPGFGIYRVPLSQVQPSEDILPAADKVADAAKYAQEYKAGSDFPPVFGTKDPATGVYTVDGARRVLAAKMAGADSIRVADSGDYQAPAPTPPAGTKIWSVPRTNLPKEETLQGQNDLAVPLNKENVFDPNSSIMQKALKNRSLAELMLKLKEEMDK